MAQLIQVNDRVADTVNKIGTASQVVSALSRSRVNSKSVVTLTVPTGTIVVDEDLLTISHVDNPNGAVAGRNTYVIGQ